jgi:hypothetical protein
VFITSDSLVVEKELRDFLQSSSSHSIIVTGGGSCHIDVNTSNECYEHTVALWFVLSLSQLIVTQSFSDEFHSPFSSFSRYAGLYGLSLSNRKDSGNNDYVNNNGPFRAGKYCGDTSYPSSLLFQRQQGNWICY